MPPRRLSLVLLFACVDMYVIHIMDSLTFAHYMLDAIVRGASVGTVRFECGSCVQ